MSRPQRIVRSRAKGFRLPPNARCVTRPGPYGNPFVVGMADKLLGTDEIIRDRAHAVELYRLWLRGQPKLIAKIRHDLFGRDLACYCPLDGEACHAGDVLLPVAAGWLP